MIHPSRKGHTRQRDSQFKLGSVVTGLLLLSFLGCELTNNPPVLQISVEDNNPVTGSTQTFTAAVSDLDEDPVIVTWSATAGVFSKHRGETVDWTAPMVAGTVVVTAVADDRKAGGVDTARVTLSVGNSAPVITDFYSDPPFVKLGNSVDLICEAHDDDGEDITYEFQTVPKYEGQFTSHSPEDNTAVWTAPLDPDLARVYQLVVKVADEIGQVAVDTTEIVVYSEYGSMWIVDSEKSRVSKYTAGGDKILSADHDFGKPVAVANHIDEYFGCYVADHDADEILKFDAKGELMTRFTGIPNVVDLAIHDGTGTLWAVSVSDDDPRLTVINTFTGSEIATVKGLQRPVTIVINQTRGDVWIADIGDTDRIVQIKVSEFLSDLSDTLSSSFAETHDGNFDFDRPIDPGLAILDAPEATLYFTDTNHNEVERLIFNNGTYDRGTPVSLETGVYPSKVEVSPAGDVWVLGLDGSIWTFDEESTSDRTPVSEFNDVKECLANPRVMVADHTTGNVWIADNGTNLVFEITISDTVGVKIGGFEFVEDLVINK